MLKMGDIYVMFSDPHWKSREDVQRRGGAVFRIAKKHKASLVGSVGDIIGDDSPQRIVAKALQDKRASRLEQLAKQPLAYYQIEEYVKEKRSQESQKARRILSEKETLELIVQESPQNQSVIEEYALMQEIIDDQYDALVDDIADEANKLYGKFDGQVVSVLGNHDPEILVKKIKNTHWLPYDGPFKWKGHTIYGWANTYEGVRGVKSEKFPHYSNHTYNILEQKLKDPKFREQFLAQDKNYQNGKKANADMFFFHKVVGQDKSPQYMADGRKGDYDVAARVLVEEAVKKNKGKLVHVHGGHIHDGGEMYYGMDELNKYMASRTGPDHVFVWDINPTTNRVNECIVYRITPKGYAKKVESKQKKAA